MHSFEPFRVVGSICGSVPISFTYLYGEPVLMIATGRTFQLYKGISLRMIRGGPTYPSVIRAVAQTSKYRFVAEGSHIHAMVHHKPLWTVVMDEVTEPSVQYLLAQDDLLFAVGEHKHIVVYDAKTGEVRQEIRVEASETVTCLALMPGYTNKLLVGTAEGSLQLYNYQRGSFLWSSKQHSGSSPIFSLAASAFKDIVACGTGDGRVVLVDILADETITEFHHTEGAVTSVAFRVDKDGYLVSGTSLGEVVVWDINNRSMDGLLTRTKQVRTETEVHDQPHKKAVHSIVVFPPFSGASTSAVEKTAPLIVTGGADNALVQFRFDTVDGLGLMVRERRGHSSTCTAASFYNNDLLLTASTDQTLRVTHLFSDRASWELSQGRFGKRVRDTKQSRDTMQVPPVTSIVSSTVRNYQWSSVMTLHDASAITCGWRMDTRAQDFKLSGIKTTSHTARAIAMSCCGNFAVVGYSSGHAVIMNIQNRSIRQLFDPVLEVANDQGFSGSAHQSSIETVQVVNDNNVIVTAGLDGLIKFWSLHTGEWKRTVVTGVPVTKSCVHAVSSLLILVQHTNIVMYHGNPELDMTDAEMAVPVRRFVGHTSTVTAIAISPDSHSYIVSSSADGMLLLWDIAAAACVGQYRFATPATSLAFHPDSLFLITTHSGEASAFLWSNHLRYGFVPEVVDHPELRDIESVEFLAYPKSHGAPENAKDSNKDDEGDDDTEVELYDSSRDIALLHRESEKAARERLDSIPMEGLQISKNLPSLAWFHLTVLDSIKEKNQPLLPPKKKNLPFFLATSKELRPTFLVTATAQASEINKSSPSHAQIGALTAFQQKLLNEEYEAIMKDLLQLGSNLQAVDLELKQAVSYVDGVEYESDELEQIQKCLVHLLQFLLFWVRRGEEVDFVQGIMVNVLQSHASLIGKFGSACTPVLEALEEAQGRTRYAMDHLVYYPSCLAGTMSGTTF